MKMGAHVDHESTRPFLLDEERLRKLSSLFNEHLGSGDDQEAHQFKVYRGDSFFYVTSDINDVLSEDNEGWKKITRLELFSPPDNKDLTFSLRFDAEDTSLEIEGKDRGKVFLLYSDLREYINSAVTASVSLGRVLNSRVLLPVVMTVFFLSMGVALLTVDWSQQPQDLSKVDEVLGTDDIRTKLDFLIANALAVSERFQRFTIRYMIPMMALILLGMPLLLITALTEWPERLGQFLQPGNVFIFGAQQRTYEKRLRLRARIAWGIGMAFLVSVIAGIVVWYITRRL